MEMDEAAMRQLEVENKALRAKHKSLKQQITIHEQLLKENGHSVPAEKVDVNSLPSWSKVTIGDQVYMVVPDYAIETEDRLHEADRYAAPEFFNFIQEFVEEKKKKPARSQVPVSERLYKPPTHDEQLWHEIQEKESEKNPKPPPRPLSPSFYLPRSKPSKADKEKLQKKEEERKQRLMQKELTEKRQAMQRIEEELQNLKQQKLKVKAKIVEDKKTLHHKTTAQESPAKTSDSLEYLRLSAEHRKSLTKDIPDWVGRLLKKKKKGWNVKKEPQKAPVAPPPKEPPAWAERLYRVKKKYNHPSLIDQKSPPPKKDNGSNQEFQVFHAKSDAPPRNPFLKI
jgi:hypothetical protein